MVPRPALDRLYAERVIDGEEYVNLLLASGWEEEAALESLYQAHDKHHGDELPHPKLLEIEPELPEHAMPTRVPARRPGKVPKLRGHPLD